MKVPRTTPREAWLFMLATVCFEFGLLFFKAMARASLPEVNALLERNRGAGEAIGAGVSGIVYLLLARNIGHRAAIPQRDDIFSLNRPLSAFGWIAAACMTTLGILASFALTRHALAWRRAEGFGPAVLSLTLITWTPFWEELALRGFLFKAFRRSYNKLISTVLVVLWTLLWHWRRKATLQYFIFLALAAVLLCFVLEETGGVRNCILCHASYNCVFAFGWPVAGLLLLAVLWCRRQSLFSSAPTRAFECIRVAAKPDWRLISDG